MEVVSGSPSARVTFYTDDLKIKLTSDLGNSESEILSITTNKDLSSPCGTFQIVLVPRKDNSNYTWFDKIDAYDYVQIELRGINDGEKFRTIMRGLIDTVSFTESYDGGTPQRRININGRDLGCLLTDHQIYYIPEMGTKQAVEGMLTYMAWKEFIPGPVNAGEAFSTIWSRFSEGLDLSLGGGQIKQKFSYMAAQSFPNERTNLWHLKGYEGPYWNAFAHYQDRPFHELFVYDDSRTEESGISWLILRPTRFKDAKGNYHNSVAKDNTWLYPPDFTFKDRDMISRNVSKNQNEVFNYFTVTPTMQLISKISFRGMCLSTLEGNFSQSENPFFQVTPYLPAYIGKYGFRKYEASTVFIDLDVGQLESKDKKTTRGKEYVEKVVIPNFIKIAVQRNRMLVAWLLHNEFLLSGDIEISGTNKAVIGTYAKNEDDKMEYYVEGVSHNWVLFNSYKTHLRVSRGQPSEGGLVGLGGARELVRRGTSDVSRQSSYNRYFFGGDDVVTEQSVYADVKFWKIPPKKEEKKLLVEKKSSIPWKADPKIRGRGATGSWEETGK